MASGGMKFTLVHRSDDNLPLCASMESVIGVKDPNHFKHYARTVLKDRFTQPNLPRQESITYNDYVYHILTDQGLTLLTMCERRSPAWVAFQFLDDLLKEFIALHGSEFQSAQRPFAFVKFDTVITRTKRSYLDAKKLDGISPPNLSNVVKRDMADVMRWETPASSKPDILTDKNAILIAIGLFAFFVIVALFAAYKLMNHY